MAAQVAHNVITSDEHYDDSKSAIRTTVAHVSNDELDSEQLTPAGMVTSAIDPNSVLHRSLLDTPDRVVGSSGIWLHLEDGRRFLDATGGAAVACLGHNNPIIKKAIIDQLDKCAYVPTTFYSTSAAEELGSLLVEGTNGVMKCAYICGSGSEANEAGMKMARQYFVELEGADTKRCKFIARKQSYHGTTLGALGLGGHAFRRKIYEPLLAGNVSRVSPCYEYRGRSDGEDVASYVQRLADELDGEFQRVGPDQVCAFVAEPIVGAALGCVPSLPGYFKAMKNVCDKYGALLILDEVMSGMGRSGYLHAWQSPLIDVKPDLQVIGKGLSGGYQPVAALLLSSKIVEVLTKGTGSFVHGHTYQAHPVGAAAAVAVQREIMKPGVMKRVRALGQALEAGLNWRLADKAYIGNIRGMGLFWGIEFVTNKATKQPFPAEYQIAQDLHRLGMQEPYMISLYPGTGSVNGTSGDFVLIAPPYIVTDSELEMIMDRTAGVIEAYFESEAFQRRTA